MSQHSYSFICLRYFLVWLCISMIIIQLSQAYNDDLFSSPNEDDNNNNIQHSLGRRNSKKVAQMLQQILRRGEMQVDAQRIHEFLHRLHRK